jgi:hypothetical protein
MSDLLREELRTKKRLHQQVRLKLAKFGMNAPPELMIEEEDLAADVRAIERELGADLTPTIHERRAYAPPPRYEAPVEPVQRFQERMVGHQMKARQADIEHQMNLLNIHRRNLGHLRAQLRELGAHAPPYVRNGVQDAMREIASRKAVLRDMGQAVDDLPGDE